MMEGIKLRKFKMSDAERVYDIFANDNILKNLMVEIEAKDLKLKEEKVWLEKVLRDYKKKKPENFDLAIIIEDELIGSIGAHDIDWKNEKTKIGYWIGEDYWGKGYTSEAMKQFVNILFKKFGFRRIEATPFAYNKASQRVLEKAGFGFEGKRKKAIKKGNKFLDDMLYANIR